MVANLRRFIYEQIRCTRHNIQSLSIFHLAYRGGFWHVSDGRVRMRFAHYPYLAFHDIEGYLYGGRWKPQDGMTVLDVGGCRGEYAIYASKRVGPTGKVLLLEPDPTNIELAKKNIRLNGNPSNIEIIPAGLWSERGTVSFAAGYADTSSIVSLAESPPSEPGRVMDIPTESLASLVERYKLERMDMVKMDIEGAELQAVAGAAQLPPQLKPRYAIASYHIVNGKRTADMLGGLFSKIGYHTLTGNPRHLTTYASPTPFDQSGPK
jgi:FkbM family methyltransferase